MSLDRPPVAIGQEPEPSRSILPPVLRTTMASTVRVVRTSPSCAVGAVVSIGGGATKLYGVAHARDGLVAGVVLPASVPATIEAWRTGRTTGYLVFRAN
jgi:hypothetical protein